MDKNLEEHDPLKTLLQSWGMEDQFITMQKFNISMASFPYLTEVEYQKIFELDLGNLALFRANHVEWKKQQNLSNADDTSITLSNNSSIVSWITKQTDQMISSSSSSSVVLELQSPTNNPFELTSFFKSESGSRVLEMYNEQIPPRFTPEIRDLLCSMIVRVHTEQNKHLSLIDMRQITAQIVQAFPEENPIFSPSVNGYWGTPGTSQYHIQTDEGPERYFRYQTDNGQFRKEKRLQDGTVIGTDAWIDGFGYLRQNDYIADTQGYRILKSKTVFVGKDRPIQEAIQEAKKAPAQHGTLVKNPSPPPEQPLVPVSEEPFIKKHYYQTYSTTTTTTPSPIQTTTNGYSYPTPANAYIPPVQTTYLPPAAYTPTTTTDTPTIQSSTEIPTSFNYDPTPIAGPVPSVTTPNYPISIEITPRPFSSYNRPQYNHNVNNDILASADYTPSLNYDKVQSSTPYPIIPIDSSTPKPFSSYENNRPLYSRPSDKLDESNSGSYQYYHRNSDNLDQLNRDWHSQQLKSHHIPYDGVSVTSNGFSYYLPRQYHEENNSGSSDRTGSFGYIDPFGIRRVVYYNTSPNGGFQHRKNNRYVGFNSTPYDPRPS